MSRIFHVRLNLDDLSAHNDTFATDAERGEWLRGFLTGARGAPCRFPEGCPAALGHALGASSLAHAKQFAATQADKGRASAEARKLNRGSTVVQPNLNRGSTEPQPDLNLSNNPISNNQEPESNNQDLKAPASPVPVRKIIPPTIDMVRAYCAEIGSEIDPETWMDHYTSNGWKVGKSRMVDWQATVRKWSKGVKRAGPTEGSAEWWNKQAFGMPL